MGSAFKIVLYTADEATARRASRAAFERIAALDAILSDYEPESELMRLCDRAGGPPVAVSDDLFDVLAAVAGDVRAIGRGVRRRRSPRSSGSGGGPAATASCPTPSSWPRPGPWSARTRSGSTREARTVQLLKPGMKLDLGGIAKGYAADEAIAVLKQHGIDPALVAGAGDIVVSGPPPERRRLDHRHRPAGAPGSTPRRGSSRSTTRPSRPPATPSSSSRSTACATRTSSTPAPAWA